MMMTENCFKKRYRCHIIKTEPELPELSHFVKYYWVEDLSSIFQDIKCVLDKGDVE